jgi:hypothetical protein
LTNVLLKYNANSDIVQKARRFQKQVEKKMDQEYKRVVIPGVEARTEYKAAYCVPNSLGLIFNYWEDRVGAKSIGAEITKLEEGGYITDAAFYAQSRQFKHYIPPLCSRNQIKALIDANLPVLAFVPGHVIAVF